MDSRYPHLSRLKIPFEVANTGCFAVSAEAVVEEGRKLLRERAGKTPEARQRKILAHAKKGEEFSMQDVVGWLTDVPRRTLERDVADLVKKRALKAKGKLKTRIYRLTKWQK